MYLIFSSTPFSTSIEYEVFIEDLQTAIDNERDRSRPAQYDLSSFDYNAYHDFDEVRILTFGRSWTLKRCWSKIASI